MARLATLLVGSPAVAEEIVQRASAAVSERWAQLDRPDAYLRTSVVNGCAGILRRRSFEQRYRTARIEVADSEIPEQLIDLRSALDRLPDRQRLVVVLRYLADLPDEEIAEALGVWPATVRSLAHRALAALREGAGVSTLEERLRRDLPALADALHEAGSARPHETADPAVEDSGAVAELDLQLVARRPLRPSLAAAVVAAGAVAVVAALLINTSDSTEVATSEPTPVQPDGRATNTPEAPDGTPQATAETAGDQTEAPKEATAEQASPEAPDPVPEQPEPEQPESATDGDGGPALPGEGVDVMAGRADWTSGFFQAALYKQLLGELGFNVSDPAQLEMGPGDAYKAMALGHMDYWPNGWYPGHLVHLNRELPGGLLVGDHVSIAGEQLIAGGLQGFLVTKSFADTYGVYTMDDLNNDSVALAAFDATDHVPGNGKAEIFGCSEHWTCDDIIENQIAFSGWDNIVQIRGDYEEMFDLALEDADSGVPMVAYTWTPSSYVARLRPGDNVYWMGVENILDGSNPTGAHLGHEHDQRGPYGTGGFASIAQDQCPSATDQPDGKCPIGWLGNDILVTANSDFLEANPAAKLLFTAVRLTVLEVSVATETLRRTGADPDDVAAQWIANNRDRVDSWLAAAHEAT